jgi:hypothetical protein
MSEYADRLKLIFDSVVYRVVENGVYVSPGGEKCEACGNHR